LSWALISHYRTCIVSCHGHPVGGLILPSSGRYQFVFIWLGSALVLSAHFSTSPWPPNCLHDH
jgi:hypothetical protein